MLAMLCLISPQEALNLPRPDARMRFMVLRLRPGKVPIKLTAAKWVNGRLGMPEWSQARTGGYHGDRDLREATTPVRQPSLEETAGQRSGAEPAHHRLHRQPIFDP